MARRAPSPIAADPAAAETLTYEVVGPHEVHGKRRGEHVELAANGATAALIQAGHIKEATTTVIQEDAAGPVPGEQEDEEG